MADAHAVLMDAVGGRPIEEFPVGGTLYHKGPTPLVRPEETCKVLSCHPSCDNTFEAPQESCTFRVFY